MSIIGNHSDFRVHQACIILPMLRKVGLILLDSHPDFHIMSFFQCNILKGCLYLIRLYYVFHIRPVSNYAPDLVRGHLGYSVNNSVDLAF